MSLRVLAGVSDVLGGFCASVATGRVCSTSAIFRIVSSYDYLSAHGNYDPPPLQIFPRSIDKEYACRRHHLRLA